MKTLTKVVLSIIAVSAMMLPLSGNADTKNICGHTLNYTPSLPAANVPANVSAFLGVWQGRVSISATNFLCVIYVVQSVDANGTAQVIQAYGDASVASFGAKVSKSGLTATKITNGILVFGEKNTSHLQIDPSNPDRIVGYYHNVDHNGKYPVALDRVQRFQ